MIFNRLAEQRFFALRRTPAIRDVMAHVVSLGILEALVAAKFDLKQVQVAEQAGDSPGAVTRSK